MKKIKIIISAVFILVMIMFFSCAVNPVTGEKQFMLMTERQEIELGAGYDPQVVSSFGEYADDDMLAFISSRGAAMGKISHRPGLEYHFKILDSPVINAFAVPGGYIYFTRGILAQLNNEAELIGIMGHEMGHVTARHSASQQSKQQLGQVLLIGGMMASEKFARYGQYAMQGMQLLFLKFSRDDERQADKLGVEYSSRIGYDAREMAEFFQVLNKMNMTSDQAGVPTFLSTHPDPGDRYNSVKRMAAEWQDSLKQPEWKVNRNSYLKMIDGMIYGEDPRQGYTEGNIFYHPGMKFKFSYPEGWQFENSPMQVAMAPKDGKAMMIFTLSKQTTPDDASRVAVEEMGLTLQESRSATVNGLPALFVTSKKVSKDESSGQQQENNIISCHVSYDNRVYTFHGVAGAADFQAFLPRFESTMTSFGKLSDPSKINVKPRRLIVKTVQKAGSLSSVLASLGVQQAHMTELALLNNMELTDNLKTGELVKIVGE
jgi:predicted Zn-dependent protease